VVLLQLEEDITHKIRQLRKNYQILFLEMSLQMFTWGAFDTTNKWKEEKRDSNGV
jgi:hypothetical protein